MKNPKTSIATVPTVLVINGLSNSGKSNFCCWLSREKGFSLVDCDNDGINVAGLRTAWDQVLMGSASALVAELEHRGRIVFDWSYNPSPFCFQIVRTLQEAAIPAWWFDGDQDAARRSCIKRNQGDEVDFDTHAGFVRKCQARIVALYGLRFLRVLQANNRRTTETAILRQICAVEARIKKGR